VQGTLLRCPYHRAARHDIDSCCTSVAAPLMYRTPRSLPGTTRFAIAHKSHAAATEEPLAQAGGQGRST
jgi:hypothetical protein